MTCCQQNLRTGDADTLHYTTEIVIAYLRNHAVAARDVPALIEDVYLSLAFAENAAAAHMNDDNDDDGMDFIDRAVANAPPFYCPDPGQEAQPHSAVETEHGSNAHHIGGHPEPDGGR